VSAGGGKIQSITTWRRVICGSAAESASSIRWCDVAARTQDESRQSKAIMVA